MKILKLDETILTILSLILDPIKGILYSDEIALRKFNPLIFEPSQKEMFTPIFSILKSNQHAGIGSGSGN